MFRNRSMEECLDVKSKAVLILKTMFDSVARLLIFSIWMYVSNSGQFSSVATIAAFYILLLVLVIFNIIFCRNNERKSFSVWIGKAFHTFNV